MTPERRQKMLILGLAVVAAVALAVEMPSWLAEPAEAPALRGPAAGGSPTAGARTAAAAPVRDVVEVDLPALEHPEVEASHLDRNPFRFGAPPPPPPPPPPRPLTKAEREQIERDRVAAEEAARQAAIEAAKPKPPPLDLLFLGSFGPEGRRVAVLADRGRDNIWTVTVGQTVASKFVVAEIGYESVALGFVGFPDVPPQRLAIGK